MIHDWGSALRFDWARRYPDRVRAIAYMEAILGPLGSWDAWPESARNISQALRSPAGEEMVLRKASFVEAILPASIMGTLAPDENEEYRRPFAQCVRTEPGPSSGRGNFRSSAGPPTSPQPAPTTPPGFRPRPG